jgi:hypothetical protein
MDTVLFLEPDAPPRALHRWLPADGPIHRFSSRPGAWYGLLYLPMTAGWPVELQIWTQRAAPSLRLLALDQAPEDVPSFAVVLPVVPIRYRPGRGDPAFSSRLRLPAASGATGVYVLVEHWRVDGVRPAPLWFQLRSGSNDEPRTGEGDVRLPGRTVAPASPLTRELNEGSFELPLPGPRPYFPEGR